MFFTVLIRSIFLLIFLNIFSSYLFILGNIGNIILFILLIIFLLVFNYINSLKQKFILFNRNEIIKEYFLKLNYIIYIFKLYKYISYFNIKNLLYILNNLIYIFNKLNNITTFSNNNIINIIFNNLLYSIFYNIKYYKKLLQLILINILYKKWKFFIIKV
jgi:hypothetical protein